MGGLCPAVECDHAQRASLLSYGAADTGARSQAEDAKWFAELGPIQIAKAREAVRAGAIVTMTYRGTNSFGGAVTERVVAKVDPDGNLHEIARVE